MNQPTKTAPHWMDCNCKCHGFHDNTGETCPHCHPEDHPDYKVDQPTTQTDSTEAEVKPTAFMLNKNQLFQLAKKYIDESDVEGFNKAFMFMTPQMFELGMTEAKEAGRQEERERLISKIHAEIKWNGDIGEVALSTLMRLLEEKP